MIERKVLCLVPGWFVGAVITGLYFGYIFLGGLVFMMLERPREDVIPVLISVDVIYRNTYD